TFSITDWIKTAPPHVAARTLGISEAEIARFPKEVYIGPGKVPEMAIEPLRDASLQPPQSSHKYRLDMQPPRNFPAGTRNMVSSKEIPIQTTLTTVKMILHPGALRTLHCHPHADEWQVILAGMKAARACGPRATE